MACNKTDHSNKSEKRADSQSQAFSDDKVQAAPAAVASENTTGGSEQQAAHGAAIVPVKDSGKIVDHGLILRTTSGIWLNLSKGIVW